jgi:GxxExxY protein
MKLTCNLLIKMSTDIMNVMGKGRSEKVYQNCLISEISRRGIVSKKEETIPLFYKSEIVGYGRADIIVQNICIELKANVKCASSASTQLMDYVNVSFYDACVS